MSKKNESAVGRREMLDRALRGVAGLALATVAVAAAAQESVVTFGTALPLTGRMSPEGVRVREGYDLYVKHINERGGIKVGGKTYKVAIKYYDDQSDANTSVKLYEKLINEDGIKLLLGPYSSAITFATSAIAEKYQVPMVAAHAAATNSFDRGFKYIFATLTPVDQYTGNMVRMAAEAKPRAQRVALIHETSLFPQVRPDALVATLPLLGLLLARLARPQQRSWGRLLSAVVSYSAIPVAHLAWRFAYYGQWAPNTYWLKLGGFPLDARLANGTAFVGIFVGETWPVLALALLVTVLARQYRAAALATVPVSLLAYQVWTGGDAWTLWRLLAPGMPFVILLAARLTIVPFRPSRALEPSRGSQRSGIRRRGTRHRREPHRRRRGPARLGADSSPARGGTDCGV